MQLAQHLNLWRGMPLKDPSQTRNNQQKAVLFTQQVFLSLIIWRWRQLMSSLMDHFWFVLHDDWFGGILTSIHLIGWWLLKMVASFCLDVNTLLQSLLQGSHLIHPLSRMGFVCRLFLRSRLLHGFQVGRHFLLSPCFPLHVPKY